MADPDYQRRIMCYVALIAVVLVALVMALLNFLIFERPRLGAVEVVLAVASAGTIAYLNRTSNVALVAPVVTLTLAIFLMFYVWEADATAPTLALPALFPGVAFFLLGSRRGLLAVMVFFPLAVWSF
ncbi:MAG: hypothetical protein JJT95_12740, partial [Pararhodobacter sp.]|nr:hypothetical protein [Pararhodobacter sp.]